MKISVSGALGKPFKIKRPPLRNVIVLIVLAICIFCLHIFGIAETMTTMLRLEINADIANDMAKNDIEYPSGKYIKWMEFNVPVQVLQQAFNYDIASYNEEVPLDWIQLLAYGAARNWGTLKDGQKCAAIDEVVLRLRNGERMQDITDGMKLYRFYLETYGAVLGGYVGEFEVETENPENPQEMIVQKKYGLKVFSPIAKGFSFSHYDDFGVPRTYGYKRRHLGHDLMGSAGTPIIAVEDGYVEVMGWNQLGGWRIGIRSNDGRRYYYYAHLKKDHPFVATLEEGQPVQAGDVIGYLGMTGYSANANANNIKVPHLHLGIEIIFNEEQKDGNNQIWVDAYSLTEFLNKNRMPVYKDATTKDYKRVIQINNIPME